MGDGGSSDPNTYIGSIISLTSKSEIRYEGVLYTLDTHNSNIALQNVRSFGTEGRKKEGPEIPSSDKVYEYIIFRGSDIKDLQVKSSPPVQVPSPLQHHNDPAIISLQARFSESPAYHPAVSLSADQNPSIPYLEMSAAAFQNDIPSLYQSASAIGAWGAPLPPPGTNGAELALPMYWSGSGYYRTQTGQPHPQTQYPLLHSVPLPPIQPQPLMPPLDQGSISIFMPPQLSLDTSERSDASTRPDLLVSSPIVTSITSTTGWSGAANSSSLPSITAVLTPSRRESRLNQSRQEAAQYSSALHTSASSLNTAPKVALPSKMTISGPQPSPDTASAFDKARRSNFHINKPKQMLTETHISLIEPRWSTSLSAQIQHASTQPLLPLPVHKKTADQGNGLAYAHHVQRGRRKARGTVVGHPLHQFMEEFDFVTMNEKFNKDEVWGELGKCDARERVSEEQGDLSDGEAEDDTLNSNCAFNKVLDDLTKKPVYVKDEFFDTLSCAALDQQEGRSDWTKFSVRHKIDAETFGSLPVTMRGSCGRVEGHRGRYSGRHSFRGRRTYQGNVP